MIERGRISSAQAICPLYLLPLVSRMFTHNRTTSHDRPALFFSFYFSLFLLYLLCYRSFEWLISHRKPPVVSANLNRLCYRSFVRSHNLLGYPSHCQCVALWLCPDNGGDIGGQHTHPTDSEFVITMFWYSRPARGRVSIFDSTSQSPQSEEIKLIALRGHVVYQRHRCLRALARLPTPFCCLKL